MQRNTAFHTFSLFSAFPVLQGYFDRTIGTVMHDGHTDQDVLERMASILGCDSSTFRIMSQVHGNAISYVDEQSAQITPHVDGLLTDKKQLILGTKTADCLPIIFYDPVHQIIATCHAGYKGLLQKIIQETLTKMNEQGSQSSDIMVGIGPSICGSCYSVPEDRITAFGSIYPELRAYYTQQEGTYFLDLQKIARYILESEGVSADHIEFSPFCTKEHTDRFYSRRAEPTGIFLTVIGMI